MEKIKLDLDFGILGEREVEVGFAYSPRIPGRMYMKNGDPGYPEEPSTIEILSITYNSHTIPFPMWVDKVSALEELVKEYHEDD
jgi:hypothetical protein